MSLPARIRSLVHNLLHGSRIERELDEEVRACLDLLTEEKRRQGMGYEQARRAAALELGGVEQAKERVRDVRVGRLLEQVWQDVRYGARMLAKRPGFAFVTVITLALGIGANTAIFTVVDAALLRPLPYQNPGRLVHLWEATSRREFRRSEASYPTFVDWVGQNKVFSGLAGYNTPSFTLTGRGAAERVDGVRVTPNFFEVLGVRPALGQAFLAQGPLGVSERTLVVTHGFWQRRLGGERSVLGETFTLNGEPYTLVGILPEAYHFALAGPGENPEVYIPLALSQDEAARRNYHWLRVLGRLKPNVGLALAQTEMNTIHRQLEMEYPEAYSERSFQVVPLNREILGQMQPLLLLLSVAVGLVLLIACANLANLLLVRADARAKEIAIRAALGADRFRLVRQLMVESLLLGLLGGALGLLLALAGVRLLESTLPPSLVPSLPYLQGLGLNLRILTFAATLSVLTSLLFGLLPAVRTARCDLNEALKEGGRTSGVPGRHVLGKTLAVTELALAEMLLIGATLTVVGMVQLLTVDPGFDTNNLLTMRVSLPAQRYENDARIRNFHQEFSRRISSLPGIVGVSSISKLPLSGGGNTLSFLVEGQPEPAPGKEPEANARIVAPNYFRTMGIPLLRGRVFDEGDRPDSPPVLVVNDTLARHYLPGENPANARLHFPALGTGVEVVGVVGDVRIATLDLEPPPAIYVSAHQFPTGSTSFVIRTAGDPLTLIGAIRREIQLMDTELPLYGVVTMEGLIDSSRPVFLRKYLAFVLTTFSLVALTLGIVGIYGVLAHAVGERHHEIGVRMALGATRGDVLRWVLGQGIKLTALGLSLGMVGAYALTGFMEGLLFGVSPNDARVFIVSALLLGVVALLACYLPARRATRVDPMVALRYE